MRMRRSVGIGTLYRNRRRRPGQTISEERRIRSWMRTEAIWRLLLTLFPRQQFNETINRRSEKLFWLLEQNTCSSCTGSGDRVCT
jgi:hypothetical protein